MSHTEILGVAGIFLSVWHIQTILKIAIAILAEVMSLSKVKTEFIHTRRKY